MAEQYRNLPLNPLRAFAIAAQYHTFTAAANHMGISQVAISRQIAILEGYLGVQLFERRARSVKLTEVGKSFSREIIGLFHDLEMATHRVLRNEREMVVHLRIYPTLVHYWLSPRLSRFYDAYPGHSVRLDTTVQPLDFRGTHLDLAFQLGQGEWGDARCRKLFDETIDVVCSPAYAERFNGFRSGADLAHAALLHAKYRRREWDLWAHAADQRLPDEPGMIFESSLLAYGAARDGLGLAIGQIDILQDELDSGRLVRPFMTPVKTGSSFYLVWPTVKSVATPTRHFVDWLLSLAGEPREFFRQPARE
ncbi:LysR family glycine cleavage system transcriptional activator [Pseudochelatococcus lubricantis]|uniref:LysR family glycine cleavage system transcriptional activator n=1 Tax=Pseudochelatococcus lubricantis TaxID=1538102 RepID=A0ABX0V3H6_9HYPH|nr:LysR substrate-binding domain-containing protein [Pseudochelatococcus lubricantis]NIJ58910.1 LysR family glycine cleavage system transcriptional activator [Pseudochelatococcus lubricantis]